MSKKSKKINFKNTPYIIAEIGINHNGYFNLAKKMVYNLKKLVLMQLNFKKEMQKI